MLRSLLRTVQRHYPRALTPATWSSSTSAEVAALRASLCDTPFSRSWQPTDPAIVAHSLLYADAEDLLPMIGARGVAIVQRAWEKARANDCMAEDYDAFASRFALWLLERLALLQSGLACPDVAPGLVEALRIRSYLETPDRMCTTQIAESWIRHAEALGLCRLRVRVGTHVELDILLQQDDCPLFPVLGIALAGASLESRHTTVQDLIQRLVLPAPSPAAEPAMFPAMSSSDPASHALTQNDSSPYAPTSDAVPQNGMTPEPEGHVLHEEARSDDAVRTVRPGVQASPSSIASAVSPTLVPSTPATTDTTSAGTHDIPFPEKPVVSREVDEAVNAIAPFARDWFGIRAPTAGEREAVGRRMRSTVRQLQEDFGALYRRIRRQGRLPSIEEFFLTVCVHCEIARRHPGMEYPVASGPMPLRQGIVHYRVMLPHLPALTVVVKPSRCHPLARLAVLLHPDMRELSGAVWLLKRK